MTEKTSDLERTLAGSADGTKRKRLARTRGTALIERMIPEYVRKINEN
jgi:hypothetical protein